MAVEIFTKAFLAETLKPETSRVEAVFSLRGSWTSLEGVQLFSKGGRYQPLEGKDQKRLRFLLLGLADWVRMEHLPHPVSRPGGELRITLDLGARRGEASLRQYGLMAEGDGMGMEDLGEFELTTLAEAMGWGAVPRGLYLVLERFPLNREDYLLHGPIPQGWSGAEALGKKLFQWAKASYGSLWDLVGIESERVSIQRERVPITGEDRATFFLG